MTAVTTFIEHYNYVVTIFLMMAGLYIVAARGNMVKKLVGLGVFQTSVYLLYLEPGKIMGGTLPVLDPDFRLYSNAASRADPDRDRRRHGDDSARPRAGRAHQRSLRHHRGR